MNKSIFDMDTEEYMRYQEKEIEDRRRGFLEGVAIGCGIILIGGIITLIIILK